MNLITIKARVDILRRVITSLGGKTETLPLIPSKVAMFRFICRPSPGKWLSLIMHCISYYWLKNNSAFEENENDDKNVAVLSS